MKLNETKDPFEILWEDDQERVEIGNAAQKTVINDFRKRFPGSICTYMAPPRSQKTDIQMKLQNGETVRIECKFIKKWVTIFEMTLRRGDSNSFLDWFAGRITQNSFGLPFSGLMDQERKKDKTIGFVGDSGTAKASGKVPAWHVISLSVLQKLRQMLVKRYTERDDNYLAIVKDTGISYHYIDGPKLPELGNLPFPNILRAKTDTYGRALKGSVRVAIKVLLNI